MPCVPVHKEIARGWCKKSPWVGPEGTWWLTSNGLILTAGHVITSPVYEGDVIEFNVPPNNAAGEPQPANPNDQFP